jgi:uncharacterized membrane protein YkgB
MLCGITCSIGLMFLIANLYVTFTADKTKQKQEFYNTLSEDKIEKYEGIIKERRGIYLKGYGLGIILAVISLFLYEKSGWNDKRKGLNKICFIGGITLLVNYFYYMLSPKTDYMILHLNEENQRKEWLKINKTMQFNYHIGLLLGIIASMVLAYSVKC